MFFVFFSFQPHLVICMMNFNAPVASVYHTITSVTSLDNAQMEVMNTTAHVRLQYLSLLVNILVKKGVNWWEHLSVHPEVLISFSLVIGPDYTICNVTM